MRKGLILASVIGASTAAHATDYNLTCAARGVPNKYLDFNLAIASTSIVISGAVLWAKDNADFLLPGRYEGTIKEDDTSITMDIVEVQHNAIGSGTFSTPHTFFLDKRDGTLSALYQGTDLFLKTLKGPWHLAGVCKPATVKLNEHGAPDSR